jgi:hypothetical protein
VLEFRISWTITLRLVETWWLGHEASTVSDINHGSVEIKSPPCELFCNSVNKNSVKYKDGVSPLRRDELELHINQKEKKNDPSLRVYLLHVSSFKSIVLMKSKDYERHSETIIIPPAHVSPRREEQGSNPQHGNMLSRHIYL